MSSTVIPSPLLPKPQWTRGEGIDDLKLHRRIDVPLDQLGAAARGWGSDFASFAGTFTGTQAGSAGTIGGAPIAFTPQIDTASGWGVGNANAYQIQADGLYLITAQFAVSTATTLQIVIGNYQTTDTVWPIVSPAGDAVVGGGAALSVVRRFAAADGDSLYVQHLSSSLTALAATACWLFIQQLSY